MNNHCETGGMGSFAQSSILDDVENLVWRMAVGELFIGQDFRGCLVELLEDLIR